jgi:hypothetical protein
MWPKEGEHFQRKPPKPITMTFRTILTDPPPLSHPTPSNRNEKRLENQKHCCKCKKYTVAQENQNDDSFLTKPK